MQQRSLKERTYHDPKQMLWSLLFGDSQFLVFRQQFVWEQQTTIRKGADENRPKKNAETNIISYYQNTRLSPGMTQSAREFTVSYRCWTFYHTFKSLKYPRSMILCGKTYLKMHKIAQNGVNALRLRTRTLRIRYADFTRPLTQDDTVQSRWMRSLRGYWHGTVSSRVSGAFEFASSLLKLVGMINVRLGTSKYAALSGIHCLTGCDTCGNNKGIGKKTAFKPSLKQHQQNSQHYVNLVWKKSLLLMLFQFVRGARAGSFSQKIRTGQHSWKLKNCGRSA